MKIAFIKEILKYNTAIELHVRCFRIKTGVCTVSTFLPRQVKCRTRQNVQFLQRDDFATRKPRVNLRNTKSPESSEKVLLEFNVRACGRTYSTSYESIVRIQFARILYQNRSVYILCTH